MAADRTSRFVDLVLDALSCGENALIVAHPMTTAEQLLDAVVEEARRRGIACNETAPEDTDAPWIDARPFGPCALFLRKGEPTRVFIHHSAAGERGCYRPPAVRTVFA